MRLGLGLGMGRQRGGAAALPPIPLPAGPLLGVNLGNIGNASEVAAYETWLGRPIDSVNLHTGRADWLDYVTSIGFVGGVYAGVDRARHWSIPGFIEGGSLAAAAAGEYDDHWTDAAEAVLANAYPETGPILVRSFWEMNYAGQPWYSHGNEAAFVAAWRRFVGRFRAVSNRFKFVWCPNFEIYVAGPTLVDPELSYPGDAFVDIISMDFYVNLGGGGFAGNPAGAITYYLGGNPSTGRRLNWLVAFAAAHGKPWGIDEWGVASDGFESYIAAVNDFCAANDCYYSKWWELNSGGQNCKLSGNQYPNTGDGYRAAFGAPPDLYLGQVATRCHISKQTAATPKQMMLRTYHVARDDITAIQIAEAAWYVNNSTFAETAMGANMIVTASIEYPLNVCTRLLWGGSTSGTVTAGATLVSDPLSIVIPKGAMFAVRRYVTCTAGIPFTSFNDTGDRGFGADIMGYAASGITDQTMSNATVTSAQGPGTMHYPAAILAMTRKPSLGVIGDSRNVGTLTTSSTAGFDESGDLGEIQRSIGKSYGCLDLGIYGEKLQNFVASHARRVDLAQYCSHICVQMGINDVTGGRSAAQVAADTATIAGYFPGKVMVCSTIAPISTSSDSWATTGNQTPHANNATRLTVNAARRALPSGFAACWEVADQVESARDSGRWKAPGPYTADGTHESELAYAAIASSGAVNPADLVRVAA